MIAGSSTSLPFPDLDKTSWSKSPLEHSLQSAAKRINLIFGRLLRACRLTHEQWSILTFLCEKPVATAKDIARSHGFDAGSLSRAIEELVQRDLLARERSRDDRRVVLLTLTPMGESLLRQLQPVVTSVWNSLLRDFDEPEVRFLINLLQRLSPEHVIEV